MDIDGDGGGDIDGDRGHPPKSDRGKGAAAVSGAPPDGKATPWVEKYRPQSLADVAAHRDIVDTSASLLLSLSRLPPVFD